MQNAANLQWPESNLANAEVRADFRFGKFPPKHSAAETPETPMPTPVTTATAPAK